MLNRIAPDRLARGIVQARGLLERIGTDPARAASENAGRTMLELGLLMHAVGEAPGTVRAQLKEAAHRYSLGFAARPAPAPNTHRSPYEAETVFNLVACFGDEQDQERMGNLDRDHWVRPPPDPADPMVRYIEVLQSWFLTGTMDVDELDAIAGACDAPNASKEQRLFLQPSCRGLVAIESEDQEAWSLALARILAAHDREARTGGLRLLALGLVSLRALMLAEAGIDAGLDCTVTSKHLPLALLDDDPE